MEQLEIILEILEASVKKNGVIPLTNQHLLNILRLSERKMQQREEAGIITENQFEIY